MATESSAVVRFIDVVQSQNRPIVEASAARVERTDSIRARPASRTPLLVGGVALVAIAAGGLGIYVGRARSAAAASPSARLEPSDPISSPATAALPAAVVAATPAEAVIADPAAVAASAPAAIEPATAASSVVEPAAPVVPVAAAPVALAPLAVDVARATGFDLRISPAGSRVSLDGQVIGVAPLRVRNLAPGHHAIDVEAPAGYFSRHLELDVVAGQASSIEETLEALEPAAAPPVALAEPRAERPSRHERRAARREPAAEPRIAAPAATPATAPAAPAAAIPSGATGTLMIGSKPPCDIVIDGKKTGLTTPQTALELGEGSHSIKLVNHDLGLSRGFKVKIGAGKTTRVVLDLLK